MKALVTGSSGFIGTHLVQELVRQGYEVIAFDRRTSNQVGSENSVKGDVVSFRFDEILEDTDVVFHLAGLLGTTELFHRIIEAEKVNVLGTLNLLESMRRKGIDHIIFTSKPNIWKYNVYTITKENCERYLEMYRKIFDFRTVITKMFNVYGPGLLLNDYRKAIQYFIIAALKNEPLELFGNGEQTLDPIYVADAVEALTLCAEKLPQEIVEIGWSTPISVNTLAKRIIDLTNSRSKVVYKPMRRGESTPKRICANNNMERLIDYRPKVNLNDGLIKTIVWSRGHLREYEDIYSYKKEDFLPL